MKFLDRAKIYVKGGDGGRGAVSFRREKYEQYGGPDGGNGGRGGDVIIRAVENLNTLIDFRYHQHLKAQNGKAGKGSSFTGRSAQNIIVKVPLGTRVLTEDESVVLADLDKVGDELLICKGGRGGIGNKAFRNSVNQAPRQFTKGKKGEERYIWLLLKTIADVGLVGFPNAGKSSLLRVLSKAKTKVANYAFTTLYPHLGTISDDIGRKLTMVDIPGIIEDAHLGKGMGIHFLRHVEKNNSLSIVLDISESDFLHKLDILFTEMTNYNKDLLNKKCFIVLNKIDLLNQDTLHLREKQLRDKYSTFPIFLVSTKTAQGIKEFNLYLLEKFFHND